MRHHNWVRNSYNFREKFRDLLIRDRQTTALLLSRWGKHSWMQSWVWQYWRLLRHRKQQCLLSFRIQVVPDKPSKLWLHRWLHRLEQLSGWDLLECDWDVLWIVTSFPWGESSANAWVNIIETVVVFDTHSAMGLFLLLFEACQAHGWENSAWDESRALHEAWL